MTIGPSGGNINAFPPENKTPALRSDIAVDDDYNNTTHYDVTNVNPISKSHIENKATSVFKAAEQMKNMKYKQVIKDQLKHDFVPLVHNSITGLPQLGAEKLFKQLIRNVANHTDQHYPDVMISYRVRLAIAAAKTMSQNLRGNRSKPRKMIQFSQSHRFTETLIAWKIRNYGGDFWSDGHEELGLADGS